MANEWSFCGCKAAGVDDTALQSPSPTWDALFETLRAADPYRRQASIHNGNLLYNHSRPWISHVSLQGLEDQTAELRARYGKPTIWDEVKYEGDIPPGWGSLSAEEMADRFWLGASLGVHVGHSETLLRARVADDAQPLWWAKGGRLVGDSPERIRWFKSVWLEALAGAGGANLGQLTPSLESFGHSGDPVANMLALHGTLYFVRFLRYGEWAVPLPAGAPSGWRVTLVDYFAMATHASTVPPGKANVTIRVAALPVQVFISKL